MTLRFVTGVACAFLLVTTACSGGVRPVVDSPAPPAPAGHRGEQGEHGEPAQEAAALSNTLRWATASEIDNFGFEVYRADSEDGPFERLTSQPIAGAGTADVPTEYSYVDDTIDPGREYFYYVESISMGGERTRFTPIMRAAAKH